MSTAPPRRGAVIAIAVIGVGLVAAPAVFQMFSRAPKGGEMIDEFRPYMNPETITDFRGYLGQIDGAVAVTPSLVAAVPPEHEGGFPAVERLEESWAAIDREMTDMLDDIEGNLDNFAAVDALPPFPLFPWFFVLPGLMLAGLATWRLRGARRGVTVAIAVIGIGLVAAPAVFQMFSRAPKGGEMIDEFEPLMTTGKVTRIQGYFLTIGAGEGELRRKLVPATGAPPPGPVAEFTDAWPTISREMAPMIGAMADNLDNYAAVAALPPFPLFPWFFVAPGVLAAGLAFGDARSRRPTTPSPDQGADR